MSRSLTASMIAACNADAVAHVFLVDLNFASGWVRAWNGYGDLVWSSNTYTGVGTLLSVTSLQERQGAVTTEVTLMFTPQASLLALALGEAHRGRRGIVRMGLMDGTALLDDPAIFHSGIMEPMSLADEGDTGRIELKIVSRIGRLDESRERRLTDQEQRRRFPNDAGLEFGPSIQEKRLTWSSTR